VDAHRRVVEHGNAVGMEQVGRWHRGLAKGRSWAGTPNARRSRRCGWGSRRGGGRPPCPCA
jgi:hypothetical protein